MISHWTLSGPHFVNWQHNPPPPSWVHCLCGVRHRKPTRPLLRRFWMKSHVTRRWMLIFSDASRLPFSFASSLCAVLINFPISDFSWGVRFCFRVLITDSVFPFVNFPLSRWTKCSFKSLSKWDGIWKIEWSCVTIHTIREKNCTKTFCAFVLTLLSTQLCFGKRIPCSCLWSLMSRPANCWPLPHLSWNLSCHPPDSCFPSSPTAGETLSFLDTQDCYPWLRFSGDRRLPSTQFVSEEHPVHNLWDVAWVSFQILWPLCSTLAQYFPFVRVWVCFQVFESWAPSPDHVQRSILSETARTFRWVLPTVSQCTSYSGSMINTFNNQCPKTIDNFSTNFGSVRFLPQISTSNPHLLFWGVIGTIWCTCNEQ